MLQRLFGAFAAPPGVERVHVVEPAEIKAWVDAGQAMLVDVREGNEFAAEHIPGARHVPLSAFDPARVVDASGRKLVIHCRSGARCGMAAMRLLASGYEGEIYRMRGGIIGWKSMGGKTRSGS
jgi:rhodanese-related sulfurtransferase